MREIVVQCFLYRVLKIYIIVIIIIRISLPRAVFEILRYLHWYPLLRAFLWCVLYNTLFFKSRRCYRSADHWFVDPVLKYIAVGWWWKLQAEFCDVKKQLMVGTPRPFLGPDESRGKNILPFFIEKKIDPCSWGPRWKWFWSIFWTHQSGWLRSVGWVRFPRLLRYLNISLRISVIQTYIRANCSIIILLELTGLYFPFILNNPRQGLPTTPRGNTFLEPWFLWFPSFMPPIPPRGRAIVFDTQVGGGQGGFKEQR